MNKNDCRMKYKKKLKSLGWNKQNSIKVCDKRLDRDWLIKTTMLRSSLYDASDRCIPLKGNEPMTKDDDNGNAQVQARWSKRFIFKTCAALTKCTTQSIILK